MAPRHHQGLARAAFLLHVMRLPAATLGLRDRLAGDRAINMAVTALRDESQAISRLIDVGRQLRDVDGADVLILGCAGMARYRQHVEQALGVPVIDPTQAAVGQAITALALGWRRLEQAAEQRSLNKEVRGER